MDDHVHIVCFDGTAIKIALDGTVNKMELREENGDVSKAYFARGITSTPDGILFVADNTNNCIKKITPDGRTSILCGSSAGFKDGQRTQAQFFRPAGMTCTPDGTLYLADSGNNRIRRVTTDGTVTTLCGSDRAGAKDGKGNEAEFNNPRDVAYSSNDRVLYVADSNNHNIRKVTLDGTVTTLCGSTSSQTGYANGQGSEAKFDFPRGITVAEDGIVYVSDRGSSTIRKVTPNGEVTLLCGTPYKHGFSDAKGNALFARPSSVVTSPDGILYVADSGNSRVRRVTRDGTVTTLHKNLSPPIGIGYVRKVHWSTNTHKYFPPEVKRRIVTVLMMAQRKPDGTPYHLDSLFTRVPIDILYIILYFVAS